MITKLIERIALCILATVTIGCSDVVSSIPARKAPDRTLGSILVAPLVSVLAVNGSDTLRVTPKSLTGTALEDVDSVRYLLANLSDSLYLTVSQTGVVTGNTASSRMIRLNVFAFKDRVIKGDQVLIHVTPATIPGVQLSMQPDPSDSARIPVGSATSIVARLRNPSTGAEVTGLMMRYHVSATDAKRVEVYRPMLRFGNVDVTPQNYDGVGTDQIRSLEPEGSAWIYGHVKAYGEDLQDSVQYAFSYPTEYYMSIRLSGLALNVALFRNGETMTLAKGALLTIGSSLGNRRAVPNAKVSVTFDDPSGVGPNYPPSTEGGASGNVVDLADGKSTSRRLTTPGTYRWSITLKNVHEVLSQQQYSGTIVVK